MIPPFDLLDPLPARNSTTVLEASAGTGKTFTLAGLVTRYVAEGAATLDQMLLITFGRAASQELRDRVRGALVESAAKEEHPDRRRRLYDALAGFDAATIATNHQFCQLVLKSLGGVGDTDTGVTLVGSLEDLVTEIVDDLYLAHHGHECDDAVLIYKDALRLAREVVKHPATQLRPLDPEPDSREEV